MNNITMSYKKTKLITATSLALLSLSPFSYAVEPGENFSVYITMSDNVKIAADIHLPERSSLDTKLPTLLNQTRYWRSGQKPVVKNPDINNPEHWKNKPLLTDFEKQFIDSGYAVIKIDVRGTGASTGMHDVEYSPQEGVDGAEVLDWIIAQDWSNGNVGAYGISYKAATSETLSMMGHPALKAATPWGAGYLDHYRYYTRPFGVAAQVGVSSWGDMVAALDQNNVEKLNASVRKVDSDIDGSTLAKAISDHMENPNVGISVANAEFEDDIVSNGYNFLDVSSISYQDKIEKAGVPLFKMTGWLDGITSDASLAQFNSFKQPQTLYILPTNHGGTYQASPYTVKDKPLESNPSRQQQWGKAIEFFDFYLKGENNGVDKWAPITYWNFGEEAFKTAQQWPPEGVENSKFYLNSNQQLSSELPHETQVYSSYSVDFDVTTGKYSRWLTQFSSNHPILNLNDRSNMDKRMLTYTSDELSEDIQITGQPTVTLNLNSTHPDGLVIAYLEDIAPDGTSVYITEGGLQISKRKLATTPYKNNTAPHPSFLREDEEMAVPGKDFKMAFSLGSTSVLVKKGHKIRIAIAGADKDNFVRTPSQGSPTLSISNGSIKPSFVEIPILTK